MSVDKAAEYYACMKVLRAREEMLFNRTATWPHMKKEDRTRRHKTLLKDADLSHNTYKAVTANDLKRILGDG